MGISALFLNKTVVFDANNHCVSFARCFGWLEWVIQYYSTMGIRAIELRSTPGNLLDFRPTYKMFIRTNSEDEFFVDFGLNKKERRAVAETLAKTVETRFVLST